MLKEKLISLGLVVDNKWLDLYVELINLNKGTVKQKNQTQRHHIVPKYYYNTNGLVIDNSKENLVNLYYKDHILAHYYLCRCSTNNYYGKNYASIKDILRNNGIPKDIIPELEEFVSLLEDVDVYYEECRQLISNAQKRADVRLKKSISAKAYCDRMKGTNEWHLRSKKISKKLTGVRKSDSHRKKLSTVASSRVGDKNSFYGKTHTNATKNRISELNSNKIKMITSDGEIIFDSMKLAVNYIINENKVTDKGTSIPKHINKAILNKTEVYGATWELYKSNNHKKNEYTEVGLKNIKESMSKAKGTAVILIDCSNDNRAVTFNSLAKAGQYIKDQNIDTLHYKNIARKIKKAIDNNEMLYGFIWEYN